jgi:phage host-nuclease inhibitor protein Gam
MPPKKVKPDVTPVFTDWAQVDDALRQIRGINARVAKAETAANTASILAAAKLSEATGEDLALRKQLEKNMEEYCTAQLPEMTGRSRKLNHGTISFTASKELAQSKGMTWAAVLELMLAPVRDALNKVIEKLGKRFVRVKTEVDKAAIAAAYNAGQISDAKLAVLGVQMVAKDNFGYVLADADAQPTT